MCESCQDKIPSQLFDKGQINRIPETCVHLGFNMNVKFSPKPNK